MEKIRKPLTLYRNYLHRAKMDRFYRVNIWRILLAALLVTFGLSFRGREWNTYGILIFLFTALVFVGLNFWLIRVTSLRQEKKWAKTSLIFEANADGIRVDALPGGDLVLDWSEVKAQLKNGGWLFVIKTFPHYLFLEKTKFSDEENIQLKNWIVKPDDTRRNMPRK